MATLLSAEQETNPCLRRKHVSMRPPAGSSDDGMCKVLRSPTKGAHGSHPVCLTMAGWKCSPAIRVQHSIGAGREGGIASVPT